MACEILFGGKTMAMTVGELINVSRVRMGLYKMMLFLEIFFISHI